MLEIDKLKTNSIIFVDRSVDPDAFIQVVSAENPAWPDGVSCVFVDDVTHPLTQVMHEEDMNRIGWFKKDDDTATIPTT